MNPSRSCAPITKRQPEVAMDPAGQIGKLIQLARLAICSLALFGTALQEDVSKVVRSRRFERRRPRMSTTRW